jgi:hypothetical protein
MGLVSPEFSCVASCSPPLAACLLTAPALAAPGDFALEDVRMLSSDAMQGRGIGTEGSIDARLYILGRMREIGLAPTDQEFTFRKKGGADVTGVNVMARIPGTEPGGRAIVISAHYDHLGVRDGQIYNGADDNASGVAGALAVAEAFKEQAAEARCLDRLLRRGGERPARRPRVCRGAAGSAGVDRPEHQLRHAVQERQG